MTAAVRTRADLVTFADQLLSAVEPYRSPGQALITLPGTPGGYGTAVDGLEGFARTFLLAGMRVAGERGADSRGHLEHYARGLVAGTTAGGPEAWVRPSEHGQAKVEAASLALALDWTRPWLWDRLAPAEQEQVIDYLAEVVGDRDYPRCNWLWFQIVVETFLRSVGGPHRLTDITANLEVLDSFYAGGGWYRDGDERAYDHYSGWAMQLYPVLWAQMAGAADLSADRTERDRERLGEYLADLQLLIGADGAPLIQGRSLTYRFAAAAPLWAGAMAQVSTAPLGRLREGAFSVLNHFLARGVPNRRGLLDVGWWGPWRQIAQAYSGTGSPYWAVKGLLGLLLPPEHPVWAAPAAALPHATEEVRAVVAAPGWAVSATTDGLTRVANHGTDHAFVDHDGGDSPWYARLAYSTGTSPLLDHRSWTAPVDQSVVLVDAAGRRSHRTGMRPVALPPVDHAVGAASTARAHWLVPAERQQRHGSGAAGTATYAGRLTVVSLLRRAWEVRLIHQGDLAEAAVGLEAGGWALADDAGVRTTHARGRAELAGWGQHSSMHTAPEFTEIRIEHRDDASPLGQHAAVAVAAAPAAPGWTWVTLSLASDHEREGSPAVGLEREGSPAVALHLDRAEITWPGGARTILPLTGLPPAGGGA